MNRRFVSIATCLAAALLVVSPVQGQRTRRAPAKPQAAPATLAGHPARSFPAGTMFYAEVSDTASIIDQMGGVDLLYRLVREAFKGTPSNKSTSFPLTEEQFRQVLGLTLAVGMLLPPDAQLANLANVDPTIAGVAQAGSPDVAVLLLKVLKEIGRGQTRSGAPPAPATVRGAKMSTWGTGRGAFAVTQVGDDFAFGDPVGVKSILETTGAAAGGRLVDLPAFKASNERVPGRRQFFAFLNGAPIAAAFNAGIDQSYATVRPAPAKGVKTAAPVPLPEAVALKRFIGMDALVGGSVTALAENGQVILQAAIEFDRARNGLVGILSDPPIIEGRSSAIMPLETDGALLGSVDLVRIYDLVLQTMTPELSKKLGAPAPPEVIREFETRYEMRLRDDFLAAFGNEFALGVMIKPPAAALARVQDDGAPAPQKAPDIDDAFFLMELRNPAAIRQFVERSFAGPGGEPSVRPEIFRDVEIWNSGPFAFAIVGNFAVVGARKTIEDIIVSFQTEQALLQNSDYLRALGGMPNNAIGVVYVSPDFIDMAGRQGGLNQSRPLYPQGLLWTLQKDESGIYTNFQAPLPDLKNLFDTGNKLALLDTEQEPRAKQGAGHRIRTTTTGRVTD